MRRFLFTLAAVCAAGGSSFAEDEPVAQWIWKSDPPVEDESVYFRREFELPPGVTQAVILVACDDFHRLWVNGHDLGSLDQWNQARTLNVTAQLRESGRNVIAVEARNYKGAAGLALEFRATTSDGRNLTVMSDGNWQCSGTSAESWQSPDFQAVEWAKATVLGKMGMQPWGELFTPPVKIDASQPAPKITGKRE